MVIFKDPHEALRFAFVFSSQQYAISAMGRMMGGTIGTGKGLVALDGAGQAGFILEGVGRLAEVEQACIVCRYSARFEPCTCNRFCCSGERILPEYQQALMTLDRLVALPAIGDGQSNRLLRYHVLRQYFERKDKARKIDTVAKAAERLKVPKQTAYDLKRRVEKALVDVDRTAITLVDEILQPMCGELDL